MKWGLLIFLFSAVSFAHAQYADSGSSPSASSGPKNSTTRFALLGGFASHSAQVSIGGGTPQNATGTGYAAGIELSSSTSWPRGFYTAGILFTSYQVQFNPNSVREIDHFQGVQVPLTWGLLIDSRFLLSLGAMARYEMDQITRETPTASTKLTHKDFGLSTIGVDAVVRLRYLQNVGRKQRLFLEVSYEPGLMDQAVGTADKWKESNFYAGLGIYLW